MHFCMPFYVRDLTKHPWILVSTGILEPIPQEYPGSTTVKLVESQKVCMDFLLFECQHP